MCEIRVTYRAYIPICWNGKTAHRYRDV